MLIEAPWPGESGGARQDHRYELFDGGRSIGWLEWRPQPRERLGWYLCRHGDSPVRLNVDLALDDLAVAGRRDEHGWELTAELAALLSTALALNAAQRILRRAREPARRPAIGERTSIRYFIFCSGVHAGVLARAVPELPPSSMLGGVVLEGRVPREALAAVIQRIQLLGGRVLAVLPDATPT